MTPRRTVARRLGALSLLLAAGVALSATERTEAADRMQWFRDAKFGLFIHWGPVSLVGTEIGWSRGGERRPRKSDKTGEIPVDVYDNLYMDFNPTEFNAREWVAVAKAAGMKYLVFTTKHHDGFAMFDSRLTDYKITKTPYGRDIVAQLARACHEGGLRLGFYYSPPDWHHAYYRTDLHDRYIEYMHGQIRELLSNYGRVDILWFDGLGGTAPDWGSERLFAMIRRLQPHIIINNRAGLPADFDTPEQRIGRFQTHRPWETCMTLCRQWAWRPDDTMKSFAQCIETLVRTVGGDGNLLLNVGPTPDGRIEARQVDRLKEVGDWLRKYGRSIYATRGGPFRPDLWGASTYRGDTIYLHVLDWEGDEIRLPCIARRIKSVSVLTGGAATLSERPDEFTVTVPATHRDPIDTIIALKLDGPAADARPRPWRSGSLATGAKATASETGEVHGSHEAGPDKAFDDDYTTSWMAAGEKDYWLQVDLGRPMKVGRAVLLESFSNIQAFEIQYKDGDDWKTCATGETIGRKLVLEFQPVTAQVFRLNITKWSGRPELREFHLFPPP